LVQYVGHVHFHYIPKPTVAATAEGEGLGVDWPSTTPSPEELEAVQKELLAKL